MKRGRLRITKPDGTVVEVSAPDRRTLRRVRENPILTDRQKAEMFAPCPLCGSRAGRACRSRAGRPTFHEERLEAWREQSGEGRR